MNMYEKEDGGACSLKHFEWSETTRNHSIDSCV